jgi:hypothetical protein
LFHPLTILIPQVLLSLTIYSWVDLFLMADVYILGLALDYTEIYPWWLMIFKERLKRETGFPFGNTSYYKFYPHTLDKKEEAKISILESFGTKKQSFTS